MDKRRQGMSNINDAVTRKEKRFIRQKRKKVRGKGKATGTRTRLRARFKNLKQKQQETLIPPAVTGEEETGKGKNAGNNDYNEQNSIIDESQESRIMFDAEVAKEATEDAEQKTAIAAVPEKMTIVLQTQQIRHAMAEIRNLYADRTAPILSRMLTTLPMTVQEFCYYVVLRTHKSRRVKENN